jgi:hypothetical protein
MPDWRKIGSALTSAEAALPDNANASILSQAGLSIDDFLRLL